MSDAPMMGHQPPAEDADPFKTKRKRSSKACLFCRSRKVKCDTAPPGPCSLCHATGIPCTFSDFDGRKMRTKRPGQGPAPPSLPPSSEAPSFPPQQNLSYLTSPDLQRLNLQQQPPPTHFHVPTVPQTAPDLQIPSSMPPATAATSSNPLSSPDQPNFQGSMPHIDFSNLSAFSVPDFFQQEGAKSSIETVPTDQHHPDLLFGLTAHLPVVEDIQASSKTDSDDGDRASSAGSPDQLPQPLSNVAKEQNGRAEETSAVEPAPAEDDSKTCRVTWFRPMGSTSIAPGVQRVTLRLKREGVGLPLSESPASLSDAGEPFDSDGTPSPEILSHLLDIFFTHMHCHVPIFDKQKISDQVAAKTASSLLLNSICAVSARFSNNPIVARKGLMKFEYGRVFADRAQSLLFPMLAFPSTDAIASLILLAYYEFGVDSESGLWMMSGMALRMAQDVGLHLDAGEGSLEEQRHNRLLFWSAILLDYAVCLGTGRKSTLRPEDIKIELPRDDDVDSRSAFPFTVKMCWLFFPLINLLNGDPDQPGASDQMDAGRRIYIDAYHRLPSDMTWKVNNLRTHTRNGNGSMFLQLHLNFFAAVDLAHRTEDRQLGRLARPESKSRSSSSAAALSSSAARTVGEVLVLAEVIDPITYICAPFTNQALFVAGRSFADEIQSYAARSRPNSPNPHTETVENTPFSGAANNVFKNLPMTPIHEETESTNNNKVGINKHPNSSSTKGDGSKAFLSSVAATNLEIIRQGLEQQSAYWKGVRWIEESLDQCVAGVEEVDLEKVSDVVKSYTYVSDDGIYRRWRRPRSRSTTSRH